MFSARVLGRGRAFAGRILVFMGLAVSNRAANAPSQPSPINAELGPEQRIMSGGG
jgi:hypothetical protein